VRLVRTLPFAPEAVWSALTDRDQLAEWMAENDFEPRVGHAFELLTPPRPGWDGVLRCRVLELDPPRRLVFACASDAAARRGTVTISLTAVTGGTRLVLEHEGLDDLGRGLLAVLLPPAWLAPVRRGRLAPAVAGTALMVLGVAATTAFAFASQSDASGGGGASHACGDPNRPAPPSPEEPPPMLVAERAR
jgi:uncharacterized protein YndB with AHSA1/START domain